MGRGRGLACPQAGESLSQILREKCVGHGIPSSPGLALGQALRGKQEGTHSGEAKSPASVKGAGKQGVLGARCSLAQWRSGTQRDELGFLYHFRGLNASLPLTFSG